MPGTSMTRMLTVLLALMLALPVVAWGDASSEEFSFKVAVESHLENRLNTVLTAIAGTEDIVVIVNADVKTDVASMKKAQAAVRVREQKKNDNALVLPGVPVKKELGKEKTSTVIEETPNVLPAIPTLVNRLDVTILMDNEVPESLAEISHDIAISVIGYNPDRGDKLTVKRIDFGNPKFRWSRLFQPPHLYWVLGILITGFFLTAMAIFFLNPFKKLSAAMQGVDWRSILGFSQPEKESTTTMVLAGPGAPGIPGTGPEDKTTMESGKPMPFTFINESNLLPAAFLLKDETPENIALVTNYIGVELATRLFELLPEEKTTKAALFLSTSQVVDAAQVEKLDSQLRSRLDYVVGGGDKLASILSLTPEDMRDRMFEAIESKSEEAAAQVKSRIKTFESIMRSIKPLSIQILYRQVDPTIFARVLKSVPGDIQTKVLESLTEGASTMLREEMELSRPLSQTALRKEKLNVVMAYRRLLSAGQIEEEGL